MRLGLQTFQPVRRRFERVIEKDDVLVISDYAHHPTEIAATLRTLPCLQRKRWLVVFQPHRYSRTRDLFDDFAAVLSSADAVVLADVYPAGEAPIVGADAKALARAIRARGRIDPVLAGPERELPAVLADVLEDGDLLLVMGAGDIGAVVADLAAHGIHGEDLA